MKIHNIDIDNRNVTLELDEKELHTIYKLMFDSDCRGYLRSNFFLLSDLLSHGAHDEFAIHTSYKLLTEDTKEDSEDINHVCGTCRFKDPVPNCPGSVTCTISPYGRAMRTYETCTQWAGKYSI